jgi:hypothetical protein
VSSAPGSPGWLSADCNVVLRAKVRVTESGWLAARCWGREDVPGPRGIVAAHTSPVYLEAGGRKPFSPGDAHYMMQVMDEMLAWAKDVVVVRHPQKRLDLLDLFAQAKQALHDRLSRQAVTGNAKNKRR